MSRLDILLYGSLVLLTGGGTYLAFQWLGINTASSQVWASGLLMLGFVLWIVGYLKRVLTGQMSLQDQEQAYETAALREQLEAMTPEQLAAFQAEIEAEADLESLTAESSESA